MCIVKSDDLIVGTVFHTLVGFQRFACGIFSNGGEFPFFAPQELLIGERWCQANTPRQTSGDAEDAEVSVNMD